MTIGTYLILSAIALGVVYLVLRAAMALRWYLRFRGLRMVTCPETERAVGVQVAAGRGAAEVFLGSTRLELRECTRWPEKRDCGQECLRQVETSPAGCLVRNIVAEWYVGKTCAYCGRAVPRIDWLEHKPALMDAERRTMPWDEVPVDRLPDAMASCRPVCWNCHVAEKFRREHPELVVERKHT